MGRSFYPRATRLGTAQIVSYAAIGFAVSSAPWIGAVSNFICIVLLFTRVTLKPEYIHAVVGFGALINDAPSLITLGHCIFSILLAQTKQIEEGSSLTTETNDDNTQIETGSVSFTEYM